MTPDPFTYRPPDQPDVDHDGKVVDDWEDNPVSNAFAYASVTFVPAWCQDEAHWTNRFALWLWTSCPCCMFYRGLAVGIFVSGVLWLLLLLLYLAVR